RGADRRRPGLAPRRDRRVADEGIALTLAAEGAGGAVTRHERHLVAQWPELAGDRVEQVLVVAHREVGAADRAGEQHVADESEASRTVEEHHVAGRVAGA